MSDTAPRQAPRSTRSRHRRSKPRRRAWRLAAAVAVAATVAVVATQLTPTSSATGGSAPEPCPQGVRTLSVLAAPEIAQIVSGVAGGLSVPCADVVVTTGEPAAGLAALSRPPADRPDVWIPDSSLWADRAGLDVDGTSLAASPVVLALPRAFAEGLGWPTRPLDLTDVLASGSTPPLRLGLPDPRRSVASVGGVLALQAGLEGRPDAPAILAALVRGAEHALPTDAQQLLATVAGDPIAVAVSEQAVVRRHQLGGSASVAVYPGAAAMSLDYPFLVLTTEAPARSVADQLLAALRAGPGREALRAEGFRAAGTGDGNSLPAVAGIDAARAIPAEVPEAAVVEEALRRLDVLSRGSRMLTVIDISGSMGKVVPDAGGATRLDLTEDAAARGLALFPDDAHIGLWVFSTRLDGAVDHRELVPLGPLSVRPDGVSGRQRLVVALGEVERIPDGDTGLYDTALAAVRAVRSGWDPARSNSVVLLTDGRNDDDAGSSLPDLLATLTQEAAGGQPVPVITIGVGPDSDVESLTAISAATGGAFYPADPARVDQVLLDAIGRRA